MPIYGHLPPARVASGHFAFLNGVRNKFEHSSESDLTQYVTLLVILDQSLPALLGERPGTAVFSTLS
ncbi:hypothetical protein Y032_0014g2458 [Ancylostoma ceylanicum]|uniref:Uncharacterized protein n=1 Tax=Ancylostoma ceylanicum TaxID=53326 RepID=A0A016VBC9_9BILA|nr:hypothetical protein Y032_0014g2458 [Ancylostoma ceylanicum]